LSPKQVNESKALDSGDGVQTLPAQGDEEIVAGGPKAGGSNIHWHWAGKFQATWDVECLGRWRALLREILTM